MVNVSLPVVMDSMGTHPIIDASPVIIGVHNVVEVINVLHVMLVSSYTTTNAKLSVLKVFIKMTPTESVNPV